jgi:hypothetical protein
VEFVLVLRGEAGKQALAFRQEMDLDDPLIRPSRPAFQQFQLLAAIDQGDDAMVMRLQAVGEFTDRGPLASRKPHDVKQQLVLQRGQPPLPAQFLAEAQEASQSVTELRESFEVRLVQAVSLGGTWR